jgi:hypothetical protein
MLRQVHREAFEIGERAVRQSTLVGGAQHHPWRLICLESFLPTGCTQAPSIAGFETGKTEFGYWCRKVVAAGFGEFEKGGRHDGAHRVTADVLPAGIAATVPIKTRHWFDRTDFERLAKDIASCTPRIFAAAPVVSQHRHSLELMQWPTKSGGMVSRLSSASLTRKGYH